MSAWFQAFLLTQVVEIPIYLAFSRSLPLLRRVGVSGGASLVTHPIVWFIVISHAAPFPVLILAAEGFAFATEAILGRWFSVPRPWLASFVANSSSIMVGMVCRALFGWP